MPCRDRLTDWLSYGFTNHSTQNRSFLRRFSKAISWLGMEKTKPKTTNTCIHTHHHHFCLGRPRWASTRKVKPIWILLKRETVSGSGIGWAICKSASRSRQITMPAPHHSVFLQAGCPYCCPTNSVKAMKAQHAFTNPKKYTTTQTKHKN